MKKLFSKITPLFIVLLTGLIIALSISFYYLFIENRGGMALAGVIAFVNAVFIILAFAIERAIVRNINSSKRNIWIAESLLIIGIVIFFCFYKKIPFSG
jgi:hypothetical protein